MKNKLFSQFLSQPIFCRKIGNLKRERKSFELFRRLDRKIYGKSPQRLKVRIKFIQIEKVIELTYFAKSGSAINCEIRRLERMGE